MLEFHHPPIKDEIDIDIYINRKIEIIKVDAHSRSFLDRILRRHLIQLQLLNLGLCDLLPLSDGTPVISPVDAARLDLIELWAVVIDGSKDGTTAKRSYAGV